MVLCVTHSEDFYTIDIVQQALEQAGMPVHRLNTDEFGTRYRLSYHITRNGEREYELQTGEQTIMASQIKAVWYRKPRSLPTPVLLDAAWHAIHVQEYQTHLHMFLNSLTHAYWMSSLSATHAVCQDKLYQLGEAQEAGLIIPATLASNDAAAVKHFFFECKEQVVMKLHNPLSRSMKGRGPFFPATRLNNKDLAHLGTLAWCPMIFQEYIPKMYELRIVYIAGIFFTGKIPAEYHQVTDWRTITGGALNWEAYALPETVQEKIRSLMKALGLSFGAIDMIRRENGDYVFLEVNPLGEWGMLQKYLHYPIGETIAQQLIQHIPHEQPKSTDHYPYTG